MSFITTFDSVFFINLILSFATNLCQFFFSAHIARAIYHRFTTLTRNKAYQYIAFGALVIAAAIAFTVWSFSTSLEGTTTAIFWYSLVYTTYYSALTKHSNKQVFIAMNNM